MNVKSWISTTFKVVKIKGGERMKDEALSLMVECEECHKKFSIAVNTSSVTHKREFRVDGRSIYLTYYDCPNCSRRHFVQIDDDKSLELLKVNKRQFTHNAALKSNRKKIRKKKVDQYKRVKRQLSNYRIELMKEFTGKVIYDDEKGLNFELRFSI